MNLLFIIGDNKEVFPCVLYFCKVNKIKVTSVKIL